jgi:hypothetical protein
MSPRSIPPIRPEVSTLPGGHPHFFQRGLSRREFVQAAGGTAAAALALGSGVLGSGLSPAWAGDSPLPKPIKGGFEFEGKLFHLFPPGQGNEPSTIRDFRGLVGLAHVSGTGTGIKKRTQKTQHLVFDADCRFMQGKYIGRDGELHEGTFGFI